MVTREDLSPSQQAVQSAHAAIDFCFNHPQRAGPWFKESNYLILLSVKNESELLLLIEECRKKQLKYSRFIEPDLGNQVTAVAIEPSPKTKRLTRKLSLTLKNFNNEKGNQNISENNGNESTSCELHTDISIQ